MRSWQRVRDRIAHSSDKPREKAGFSKIASHISEVGGSHSHNVVNGFKVLCGDAPAVSPVGVVKGFTIQDAKFIDTHCS